MLNAVAIPSFRTPEAAVDAFGNIASFYQNQQLQQQTPTPLSTLAKPDTEGARLLIEAVLAERRKVLTEMESKALLAAFHSPVTRTMLARSANEAMLIAAQLGACRTWGVDSEKRPQRGQFLPDLHAHSPAMGQKSGKKWTAEAVSQPTIPKPDRLLGYPVALKIDSPDVSHKSDVQGVALNVMSASQVRDTYNDMLAAVRHRLPAARINGLTIQPMSGKRHGREIYIGLSPGSRYFRFASTMPELPARMLARYTLIDCDREMALVAVQTQREAATDGSFTEQERIIGGALHHQPRPDQLRVLAGAGR